MRKHEPFNEFKVDHRVISFVENNSDVIVLFDYMDFPKNEQARNLRCFNKEMDLKWIAEHPTNAITDCYTHIEVKNNVLKANNFAGYLCKLDLKSGILIESEFTK